MKLKVVEKASKTCCYGVATKDKHGIEPCGRPAVVKAGSGKFLCKEHAIFSTQMAKDYMSMSGRPISQVEFIETVSGLPE